MNQTCFEYPNQINSGPFAEHDEWASTRTARVAAISRRVYLQILRSSSGESAYSERGRNRSWQLYIAAFSTVSEVSETSVQIARHGLRRAAMSAFYAAY